VIARTLLLRLLLCGLAVTQVRGAEYCLDLDGKSAGAQIEHIAGLQELNGAKEYTFEAWVRPRTQGGGGRGRILDQVSSSLTFYLSDEGRLGFRPNREVGWQLSNANSFKYWTWQHVAVTSDGNFLRFFVDGKLLTSTPTNTALVITKKPIHVGNGVGDDNSPRGFDGWLDDVRVSNVCRWKQDFVPSPHNEYVAPNSTTFLYLTFDEGPAYETALDYSTYNAELKIESPLRRVKTPR
jgi:hypothetical protein